MKTNIKNVSKVFIFEDNDGYSIYIDGFKDGLVEVEAPISTTRVDGQLVFYIVNPNDFTEFLSGCFNPDSNFKDVLFEAFQCDDSTQFMGFKIKEGDFECTITDKNSSPTRIGEALLKLLADFSQDSDRKYKEAIEEHDKKIAAFYEFLEKLDVIFYSYEAEERYGDVAIGKDEDYLWYGENFVAHTQYLIEFERYSVPEAVRETYNRFEMITNEGLDGVEALRIITPFCKYGEEIYSVYIEIMVEKFNEELKYL